MSKKTLLDINSIIINCESTTSDEAILKVGKLLLDNGNIEEPYIKGMLNRDHSLTTFIGNDLAIPHGEYEVKDFVKTTGLAVMVYPNGIDWHGETVRIVIGIAAKDDDHMPILANIANTLCEMEAVEKIVASQDKTYILDVLAKEAAL